MHLYVLRKRRFLVDIERDEDVIFHQKVAHFRIVRACRDLHIKSVAIYTKPDVDCLHVKIADEAYEVSTDALKGYLDAKKIVEVAKECGADAIHPGYGFLSENFDFAREVEDAGIIFIGPKPDVIRKMGNKNIARYLMRKNGIPIVPGTEKLNHESMDTIKKYAREIGYPVILKASGGGGGRGIREVWEEKDMQSAYDSCTSRIPRPPPPPLAFKITG